MNIAENVQNIYSLIHQHVRLTSRTNPPQSCYQNFPKAPASQHIAHDSNKSPIQLQDANTPPEIQCKLHTMLTNTFTDIISKSPADFGRTNLIEMDLPTTGPPVSTKLYTIL